MPDRKLGELIIDIKGRADKLEAELKALEHKSKGRAARMGREFGTRFSSAAKRMLKVGLAAAFIGITAAMVKAIRTSARFESMQFRLEQLVGSAEKARNLFKELVEFSTKTPFEPGELVEAAATLEAFGASAKETIKPVADLAAFMGISIPEAASAFGRAFAAGAGAADILRERGVLTLIKLQTGIQDLTKLTLPEFQKALIGAMTDPEGRIAGGAERLSKTLEGKWSTLTGNVSLLFKQVGDLVNTSLGGILTKVNKKFEEFFEKGGIKRWMIELEIGWQELLIDLYKFEKGTESLEEKQKDLNRAIQHGLTAWQKSAGVTMPMVRKELDEVNAKLREQYDELNRLYGVIDKLSAKQQQLSEGGKEGEKPGIAPPVPSMGGAIGGGMVVPLQKIKENAFATGASFSAWAPALSKSANIVEGISEKTRTAARMAGNFAEQLFMASVHGRNIQDSIKSILVSLAGRSVFAGIASLFPGVGFGGAFMGSFQHGGAFTVPGGGGPDSQLVSFRASPDERVSVSPPNVTNNHSASIQIMAPELTSLEDDYILETRVMPKIVSGLRARGVDV